MEERFVYLGLWTMYTGEEHDNLIRYNKTAF